MPVLNFKTIFLPFITRFLKTLSPNYCFYPHCGEKIIVPSPSYSCFPIVIITYHCNPPLLYSWRLDVVRASLTAHDYFSNHHKNIVDLLVYYSTIYFWATSFLAFTFVWNSFSSILEAAVYQPSISWSLPLWRKDFTVYLMMALLVHYSKNWSANCWVFWPFLAKPLSNSSTQSLTYLDLCSISKSHSSLIST